MGNLCGKTEKSEAPTSKSTSKPTSKDTGKGKSKDKENQSPNVQKPPSQKVQETPKHQEQQKPSKGKEQEEGPTEDEKKAEELRRQASEHAKKRNAYYEESQAAFKRGDKAEAKELSNKGKEEQALMEETNRKAADLIFRSKNKHQPPDSIDLHLLYVDEAMQMIEQKLAESIKKKDDHLVIIHGAGHHSKDNKQLIKPAVEKMLKEKGIPFKENTPNIGCITVELKA